MAFFGGRSESYTYSWGKIKIAGGTREALQERAMAAHGGIADRIAASCNQASSWGRYQAWTGRRAARVYVLNPGRERGKRLLAAAGRGGWL